MMISWTVGRPICLEETFLTSVPLPSPLLFKSRKLTARLTSKLTKLKKEEIATYLKLLIEWQ
jgi:hypothetical protein